MFRCRSDAVEMKQDTKEEPIQQTIDLKVARKKAKEAARGSTIAPAAVVAAVAAVGMGVAATAM